MSTEEFLSRSAIIKASGQGLKKANARLTGYMAAGTDIDAKQAVLFEIMKQVLKNPEGPYAEVLKEIAGKGGDPQCSSITAPLLAAFFDGDYEWQEAIISILGCVAHLGDETLRQEVWLFLEEIAVRDEFSQTGVDVAALSAKTKITAHESQIHRFRHPYLPLHQCCARQVASEVISWQCICHWGMSCDFRQAWTSKSWFGECECNQASTLEAE